MSTNARTWFYEEPEHDAYALVERLNGTFWEARVGQILFAGCEQAEPPFRCRGYWRDEPFELEWQPREWAALRAPRALDELVPEVSRVLGLKPAFRYQNGNDQFVFEWHRDEAQGHARWQALQGKPAYKHLQRLGSPA